jgi:two-component system cell cycle response regulator
VYSLAKRHDGSVGPGDGPGEGRPCAPVLCIGVEGESELSEAPNTQPFKILLIDDSLNGLPAIENLLSDAGPPFEISRARDFDEAYEELERVDFDVILLDSSLLHVGGVDTVKQISTAVPEMPLVVLSGRDDDNVALQALRGGAEDYLVKGRVHGAQVVRAIRYAVERKKAEERLTYLALYDPLTGLANRALFQDRLEQALARVTRSGDMIALMFVDLDRFKAVNDTLGHASGDALLQEVARRIEGRVRRTDTVARLGGDEFAIILEGLTDVLNVAIVAQDVLQRLSEPLVLYGHETTVSASVGIAVRPPSEGERLLKDADAAMYHAKRNGGNDYRFYTEEINSQGG